MIADNLGSLANALEGVSKTAAIAVIVEHGTQEDRDEAVKYLKGWFWDSGIFEDS
jgi:hypothetical protein